MDHVEREQAPARKDQAFVHHPVRAAAHEAAHLREVADKGESPATPALVAAAVLAFVIPFAATLMVVAFTVAHFA